MGRSSYGEPYGEVSLFRVKLVDGDYDDGGAYWGGPPSEPLYCARNDEYRAFIRATSRAEAARLLGIIDLVRKPL